MSMLFLIFFRLASYSITRSLPSLLPTYQPTIQKSPGRFPAKILQKVLSGSRTPLDRAGKMSNCSTEWRARRAEIRRNRPAPERAPASPDRGVCLRAGRFAQHADSISAYFRIRGCLRTRWRPWPGFPAVLPALFGNPPVFPFGRIYSESELQ